MTVFKQGLSVGLMLVSMSLASCAGTWGNTDPQRQVDSSNGGKDGSRRINLRQMWEENIKKLDKQSKDYPIRKLEMLRSLLNQAPEQQVEYELERIKTSPIDYSHLDEYEQTFMQAFAVKHVEASDRVKLVALLSSKCPRYIGAEPIELYLANSAIQDPLLVLFDSYEQAPNKQTKESLLWILRDTFKTLQKQFPNNEEFVAASKKWYLSHKDSVKVNPNYHPDSPFSENQQLLIVRTQNAQP